MIIRRKRYRLEYVANLKDYGSCSSPHVPNRVIKIRKGLATKKRFEIILHEILHAGCWDLAEEAISEIAEDAATILLNEFEVKDKK